VSHDVNENLTDLATDLIFASPYGPVRSTLGGGPWPYGAIYETTSRLEVALLHRGAAKE
jgi:hypothetical protein